MDHFTALVEKIDGYVWGVPLITMILLVGIYLTIRLGGLQIRRLPKALKYMVKMRRRQRVKFPLLLLYVQHCRLQSEREIL